MPPFNISCGNGYTGCHKYVPIGPGYYTGAHGFVQQIQITVNYDNRYPMNKN
jgi:hypothetical protein